MESLETFFHLGHPVAGVLLVALAGMGEYLLPPVPGDTLMLFGFFLAGRGDLPLGAVAAAAMLGSMAGAHAAFVLGRRLGKSYFFIQKSRLAASVLPVLERYFDRFGVGMVLVNRFLPVFRGFFLFAAGMGKMPAVPTFLCATLSNAAWIFLIAYVGHRFGSSWSHLQGMFQSYVGVLGVIVLIYAAYTFIKIRRRREEAPPA